MNGKTTAKVGSRLPKFDGALHFSEGLAAVLVGEKVGYIDKIGIIVIGPQFENAGCFSEGLAVVEINNKHGYIDKMGKMVIPPQFYYASDFSRGLAVVLDRGGSSSSYIDKTGKHIWTQRALIEQHKGEE